MDRKTNRQGIVFVLALALAGCNVVIDGGSDAGSEGEASDGGSDGPGGSGMIAGSSSSEGSSSEGSSSEGSEGSTGEPACEIVQAQQWGPDATCECADAITHATAGDCGPCVWDGVTCSCALGEGPSEWCLPIPGGCTTVPEWSGVECTCEGDNGRVMVLPWTEAECSG